MALPRDTSNSFTGQVLIQTTVNFSSGHYVFVESDGRFFPYQQNGLANVEIRIDGIRIGNASLLDFRVTTPVQHSFNCIGVAYLGAGTHTFQLVGYNHPSVSGGKFVVGNESNLSIVVDPATAVSVYGMGADSSLINVSTSGFQPGGPLNYVSVLSGSHTATIAPIVVLSSGRSFNPTTQYGDAMWGTFLNNICPANADQLWTVQDLAPSAEMHAPMYGHARYNQTGAVTVRIGASKLPFENPPGEDPVQYKVGGTTTLLAFSGGIPINGGKAENSDVTCTPNSYVFIGNGTKYLWSKTIAVQSGQNGNVMLLLKTRVLDCNPNEGPGTASLQLELDGVPVGSIGVQQYTFNNTCHQRTLTASYLALGLGVGMHSVRGIITVNGLPNLSASGDMGLLYFGN